MNLIAPVPTNSVFAALPQTTAVTNCSEKSASIQGNKEFQITFGDFKAFTHVIGSIRLSIGPEFVGQQEIGLVKPQIS